MVFDRGQIVCSFIMISTQISLKITLLMTGQDVKMLDESSSFPLFDRNATSCFPTLLQSKNFKSDA